MIPLNTDNISFLCFILFFFQPSICQRHPASEHRHDIRTISFQSKTETRARLKILIIGAKWHWVSVMYQNDTFRPAQYKLSNHVCVMWTSLRMPNFTSRHYKSYCFLRTMLPAMMITMTTKIKHSSNPLWQL